MTYSTFRNNHICFILALIELCCRARSCCQLSVCLSVCLSFRLSVKRVDCDKTVKISILYDFLRAELRGTKFRASPRTSVLITNYLSLNCIADSSLICVGTFSVLPISTIWL